MKIAPFFFDLVFDVLYYLCNKETLKMRDNSKLTAFSGQFRDFYPLYNQVLNNRYVSR